MTGVDAALIAVGVNTALQMVTSVDAWRRRRERVEVRSAASDELLESRVKRAEARLRDLEREQKDRVTEARFARLEQRVDDVWMALRRNGQAT